MKFLQLLSREHRFHSAKIGAGANQGFVRAVAQQKLQRTDNDRLTRACFASDRDKTWSHLPLELFHQREIFNSQQSYDRRHSGAECLSKTASSQSISGSLFDTVYQPEPRFSTINVCVLTVVLVRTSACGCPDCRETLIASIGSFVA